jgi:hypothetical protein
MLRCFLFNDNAEAPWTRKGPFYRVVVIKQLDEPILAVVLSFRGRGR